MLLALIALSGLVIALGFHLVLLKIKVAHYFVDVHNVLIAHMKSPTAHIPARSHIEESEIILKKKNLENALIPPSGRKKDN